MENICHLVCGGDRCPLDFSITCGDLIIAVDLGYSYCAAAGITPDVSVGDFDSLGSVPSGNVVRLSPEKDETDTFAAVRYGIERGYRRFVLHCALGGRLSHTLGNINALIYIMNSGGEGEITDGKTCVRVTETRLTAEPGGYMSVIPITREARVTISGCKYSGDFTMCCDKSLGISNEPYENAAVTVHSGVVIVITEKF